MKQHTQRKFIGLMWLLFIGVMYGANVLLPRRIESTCNGSFPLGPLEQIVTQLDQEDCAQNDLVSSLEYDLRLTYDQGLHALTCSVNGSWQWTEFFVSEDELRHPDNWTTVEGLLVRHGWKHWLTLVTNALGILFFAGLVYRTVSAFDQPKNELPKNIKPSAERRKWSLKAKLCVLLAVIFGFIAWSAYLTISARRIYAGGSMSSWGALGQIVELLNQNRGKSPDLFMGLEDMSQGKEAMIVYNCRLHTVTSSLYGKVLWAEFAVTESEIRRARFQNADEFHRNRRWHNIQR